MSFRKPQTIYRKSGGYVNDDGYYNAGNVEEILIQASVQPLNHSEQAQYTTVEPQGGRQANMLKVYTDTPLYPTKQATDNSEVTEADVLYWQKRLWRCIDCDYFQSGVISHYKAIFQEIDDDRKAEKISPRPDSDNFKSAAE